jgi:hypothetical protein
MIQRLYMLQYLNIFLPLNLQYFLPGLETIFFEVKIFNSQITDQGIFIWDEKIVEQDSNMPPMKDRYVSHSFIINGINYFFFMCLFLLLRTIMVIIHD